MKDLWNKTFTAVQDITMPDAIIDAQCSYLEKATNGKIVARVSSYDGPISSYVAHSPLNFAQYFADRKVEVQEKLGNISEGDFTFEFIITSTNTPNYKYRVMFIQYDIPFYPVLIVLDERIASDLELPVNVRCDTQVDFESAVELILGSKTIEQVISSLLAIAQRDSIPI